MSESSHAETRRKGGLISETPNAKFLKGPNHRALKACLGFWVLAMAVFSELGEDMLIAGVQYVFIS